MTARGQAIIWTNDGIVDWRKYVSLGFNDLTCELDFEENYLRMIYNNAVLYITLYNPVLRLMIPHSFRNMSRYVPSQWEMSLHCNDISHWQGTYLNWSLWLACEDEVRGVFLWVQCLTYVLGNKTLPLINQNASTPRQNSEVNKLKIRV